MLFERCSEDRQDLQQELPSSRIQLRAFVGRNGSVNAWTAIYSTTAVASCIELKNKIKGCYWDWIDWLLMIAGGGIAAIFWLLK